MDEELAHLLLDPNHWVFEVVAEVLFFAVEYWFVRKTIKAFTRRRDAQHGHKGAA